MNKTCSKCKIEKNIEDFRWRSKVKGTRQSWCRACMTAYDKALYKTGNKKLSTRESQQALRQRNINYVYDILEKSSCVDCGNNDIRVLEFDHLRDKEKGVSVLMGSAYSLERIKSEIEKCEIVCANCHKIRTHSRVNSRRQIRHTALMQMDCLTPAKRQV